MSGSEAIMRYKTESLAFSIFNIGEETELKKKKKDNNKGIAYYHIFINRREINKGS